MMGSTAQRPTLVLAATVLAGGTVLARGTVTAAAAEDPANPPATAIVVDPHDVLRPISPDLFGFNQRYENNGMLSYDAANDRIFPALLADGARWPGNGAPAAVGVLIGPGNPQAASYALDDVAVEVAAP